MPRLPMSKRKATKMQKRASRKNLRKARYKRRY